MHDPVRQERADIERQLCPRVLELPIRKQDPQRSAHALRQGCGSLRSQGQARRQLGLDRLTSDISILLGGFLLRVELHLPPEIARAVAERLPAPLRAR